VLVFALVALLVLLLAARVVVRRPATSPVP
jgi:hypothetical protein